LIRRRRFLQLSLGAAAAALARPAGPHPPRDPTIPGLSARGRDGVARLGHRYLRLHPAPRTFEDVEALLAAGRPHDPWVGVRGAIARDFRDERIVVLDGWVLARAEARLCAHLTLVHGLS